MVSRRDFIRNALIGAVSYGVLDSPVRTSWAKEETLAENVEFKLLTQLKRGTESYTQGLSYFFDPKENKASLYESGGRYGKSLLRRVDAESLEVIRQVKVPREYFAEGIAMIISAILYSAAACTITSLPPTMGTPRSFLPQQP